MDQELNEKIFEKEDNLIKKVDLIRAGLKNNFGIKSQDLSWGFYVNLSFVEQQLNNILKTFGIN